MKTHSNVLANKNIETITLVQEVNYNDFLFSVLVLKHLFLKVRVKQRLMYGQGKHRRTKSQGKCPRIAELLYNACPSF